MAKSKKFKFRVPICITGKFTMQADSSDAAFKYISKRALAKFKFEELLRHSARAYHKIKKMG